MYNYNTPNYQQPPPPYPCPNNTGNLAAAGNWQWPNAGPPPYPPLNYYVSQPVPPQPAPPQPVPPQPAPLQVQPHVQCYYPPNNCHWYPNNYNPQTHYPPNYSSFPPNYVPTNTYIPPPNDAASSQQPSTPAPVNHNDDYFVQLDQYIDLKRQLYAKPDDDLDRKSSVRKRSRSRDWNRNDPEVRERSRFKRESPSYSRRARSTSSTITCSRHSQKDAAKDKSVSKEIKTEREILLNKYRKDYCGTQEELEKKVADFCNSDQEEKTTWTRSTPADLYYEPDSNNLKVTRATNRLLNLCDHFYNTLVCRAQKVNETKPKYVPPPRQTISRLCKHKSKFYELYIVWYSP